MKTNALIIIILIGLCSGLINSVYLLCKERNELQRQLISRGIQKYNSITGKIEWTDKTKHEIF